MLTKIVNALALMLFACWIFAFGTTVWDASHHSPSKKNSNWGGYAERKADPPSPQNRIAVEAQAAPAQNKSSQHEKTTLETFFEIKLTDVALIFFTAVLAWKTSGLFVETAGLRDAADKQRDDTLRLIKATEISAKAAADSVEISRAQIRAYFTCSMGARINEEKKQVIEYICKNTGQSDARKIRIVMHFGHDDFTGKGIIRIGVPLSKMVDDLGPSDIDSATLTSADVPKGLLDAQFWGYRTRCVIHFEDVFGEPRTQEFEAWGIVDSNSDPQVFMRLGRPPEHIVARTSKIWRTIENQ
jgi:hypothetical protein